MTEAEKYLKEVLCYDEEDYSCAIDVPEVMQLYADEQVKKALDEVERGLKSSDEFVYPSVYETINKLRNHE